MVASTLGSTGAERGKPPPFLLSVLWKGQSKTTGLRSDTHTDGQTTPVIKVAYSVLARSYNRKQIQRIQKKGATGMTAIVRVDPILEEFERVFGDVWAPWKPVFVTGGLGLDLDVHETKDELVIKTDLPGIAKDDLHITLEDGTLRIEAEKKEEKTEDGKTWYMRERHFGKYSRLMELPFRVAAENISATLDKGVLEIKLPKAEEAKPKQIEVKVQ
jgi:HSP20 family protein